MRVWPNLRRVSVIYWFLDCRFDEFHGTGGCPYVVPVCFLWSFRFSRGIDSLFSDLWLVQMNYYSGVGEDFRLVALKGHLSQPFQLDGIDFRMIFISFSMKIRCSIKESSKVRIRF